MRKWLALILCMCMMTFVLTACTDDPVESSPGSQTGSTAGTDEYELPVIDSVSGTVTYAVRDNVIDETEIWVKSFEKMYPNINVELEEFVGDLYEFLSTRAAAQTLPDVVLGWDNLAPFVQQNWLYPLDEFLEKDEETQYIHQVSLDGFKYCGKTYAVPAWLQFSCMVVNLDLLDTLNLDRPDYDWTIDEFTELVRKATNNTYSGLNHTDSLDQYLMMQLEEDGYHQWGYNPETQTFNLTSGAFQEAVSIVSELERQPQLVADNMRDSSNSANDDYSKKFGANADALADGKILVANQSTWDDSWLNTSLTFNWDYYPIPAATKESAKQIVHADYGVMLSTAQDPQAAWEFLKFLTFGKDGLITRMNLQRERNESNPTNNRFTIPASSHPEVSELFNEYKNVPDGVKYMYNHMDKSVKGDYSKILPDYWDVVNDNIYQAKVSISEGTDAAAVARETENTINQQFSASYAAFTAAVEQVQADFEASRQ